MNVCIELLDVCFIHFFPVNLFSVLEIDLNFLSLKLQSFCKVLNALAKFYTVLYRIIGIFLH